MNQEFNVNEAMNSRIRKFRILLTKHQLNMHAPVTLCKRIENEMEMRENRSMV